MLAMLPPADPPRVRPNVAPVMVPAWLSAMVPVSPTIELGDPSVTNPENVAAVVLLFISAPLLLMPVPFNVKPPVLVMV